MNRRQTDVVAGLLVTGVLLVGGALSWDAYQQPADRTGSMMGPSMMDAVHGTDPLVYVFGTVFAGGVVGALYLAVRSNVPAATSTAGPSGATSAIESGVATDPAPEHAAQSPGAATQPNDGGVGPDATPRRRVLDLLPEDERRVLEPVLASPGLTQIELRDRSDFSKSKVSQTVSALEKRGLLYRERQGRTYRVYPDEDVENDGDPSTVQ